MSAFAQFLSAPTALSSMIFGAVVRDTRGAELTDEERLNHFPASPLTSVTYIAQGQVHMTPNGQGLDALRRAPSLPKLSITPPSGTPITSWSAGEIYAISVAFYPDALDKLRRAVPDLSDELEHAFLAFGAQPPSQGWHVFCETLTPLWQTARGGPDGTLAPNAPARLSDWARALVARAAMAGPGQSIRSLERRLKRWSGQTRRSLDFYANFENLGALRQKNQDLPLAALAQDAGFADQSHMGRAVRRATGFSPAELNRRIENDEAFWCYRVLGERF